MVENSKARHKPEELEAARFLADKGYKVALKDVTQRTIQKNWMSMLSQKMEEFTGGKLMNKKGRQIDGQHRACGLAMQCILQY